MSHYRMPVLEHTWKDSNRSGITCTRFSVDDFDIDMWSSGKDEVESYSTVNLHNPSKGMAVKFGDEGQVAISFTGTGYNEMVVFTTPDILRELRDSIDTVLEMEDSPLS